jgi:uncharacterized RDD family membrane protein YckC
VSLVPAPFPRRLAARVIDLLFALVMTFVVAVPVAVVVGLLTPALGDGLWWGLAAAFCYFLAYVGLEVLLLVRRDGQTLGKGLMGLRVVPADAGADTRPPLRVGPAALRMLLIFLPFVLGSAAGGARGDRTLDALAGLGFLTLVVSLVLAALPTQRRQALHDLAGRTRVVVAPKRRIHWQQDLRLALPGRVDLTKRI